MCDSEQPILYPDVCVVDGVVAAAGVLERRPFLDNRTQVL